MALAITECDQCGPPGDDHPKVHYGLQTWHHDCVPYRVKQEILDGAHGVSREVTAGIFEACESGKKGDELRAHILGLHEEVAQIQADATGEAGSE